MKTTTSFLLLGLFLLAARSAPAAPYPGVSAERASVNAPAARSWPTAVWRTGSEMIVWGGDGSAPSLQRRRALQSGGQQLDGGAHHRRARRARPSHGGVDGQRDDRLGRRQPTAAPVNDGGRYNPTANSWTAVPTTGAPAARCDHTAVWTGSEMIVWGGYGGSQLFERRRALQSGGQQLDGDADHRRARRARFITRRCGRAAR